MFIQENFARCARDNLFCDNLPASLALIGFALLASQDRRGFARFARYNLFYDDFPSINEFFSTLFAFIFEL